MSTLIDFQPVMRREMPIEDLAARYTNADLGEALRAYVAFTRGVMSTVTDAEATFVPPDPDANDPYAASEAEQHVGWSLVHLVVHVTASAEEAAAFSSLLARGIAIGGRLRSETPWESVTTVAGALARLDESERMCLGYLAAWPDRPDLATVRILPEGSKWRPPNAPTQFLSGLLHWNNHVQQFERVAAYVRSLSLQPG